MHRSRLPKLDRNKCRRPSQRFDPDRRAACGSARRRCRRVRRRSGLRWRAWSVPNVRSVRKERGTTNRRSSCRAYRGRRRRDRSGRRSDGRCTNKRSGEGRAPTRSCLRRYRDPLARPRRAPTIRRRCGREFADVVGDDGVDDLGRFALDVARLVQALANAGDHDFFDGIARRCGGLSVNRRGKQRRWTEHRQTTNQPILQDPRHDQFPLNQRTASF